MDEKELGKEEIKEETIIKSQGITTEENVSVEDYNISSSREVVSENETSKEEISSENVSNDETQEQKSEENSSLYDSLSSYMSENIDLMADSRESEIAFDRGLAEALDNLDKKDFNSLSDVINDVKEKLENENDRASDKLFEQETTSEKVVEGNKDDLAEFGNAVQDFKDLTNSEEAQAYKEEQLSPENTKAGELFEKRDELMEQLENPKDGTFEIEQQLESVNEKISNLTMDELREYNNSLSAEIIPEMRDEQKISEDLSREGQKDNDTQYGNFEYKEEVEISLNRDDLVNQLEKESGFYDNKESNSDLENVNKEDLVNQLEKETSNDQEKSLDTLISERDDLKEEIQGIKEDINSIENDLKMEYASEQYKEFAEQNLPEPEREEFVNVMLDVNADSIKSQETIEGLDNQINSSIETFQEVKAELESEKSIETNNSVENKEEISSNNEKESSIDVSKEQETNINKDENVSSENKELDVSKEEQKESNINNDKEQNKQNEIDFSTEAGASR